MSDSIIRWWPKSGATMSIASMDERHATLTAEIESLRSRLAEAEAHIANLCALVEYRQPNDGIQRTAAARAYLSRKEGP